MTSVAHDAIAPLEKRCRRCDTHQPLSEFYKRGVSPDGLHLYCKTCQKFLNAEKHLISRGLLVRVPKRPIDRRCARCEKRKPLDDFHHMASKGEHRRSPWCKPCSNAYSRARFAADPALRAARVIWSQEWQRSNPDRVRESAARYRAAHPEAVAARHRAWQLANPERAKAHRVKRQATKKRATVVHFPSAALAERMNYFGNRCWMCRGPFEQVDHVKPLSKGGLHILSNLRPACSDCNNRKHAKWYGPQELHRFIKN
jgi:5-methylcytosine-specific restriction endonuclease McrA